MITADNTAAESAAQETSGGAAGSGQPVLKRVLAVAAVAAAFAVIRRLVGRKP